jgi:type II secretion system protein C
MEIRDLKHQLINVLSVILFSYLTAITINQAVKNSLTYYPSEKNTRKLLVSTREKTDEIDIDQIMESGFFPDYSIAPAGEEGTESEAAAALDELKLLGTITGDASVTMALIMKRGDKQAMIYRPWSKVGGYTITRISPSLIHLKRDNERFILNLYDKKDVTGSSKGTDSRAAGTSPGVIKKNVSRAEIQQRIMNNLDKAMEGIRGGPYKVNNQIEGFRIIRIQPTNILYEYGIRNGDIIKRINGKKIDSTEKVLNMWHGFKNESRLVIDAERNGQIITFDLNITD